VRKIVIPAREAIPPDYLTFDVATRGEANQFKFVGVFYGGEYRFFTDILEWWHWLCHLDVPRVHCYAFDAVVDLGALLPSPVYDLEDLILTESGFVMGRYRFPKGSPCRVATFWDACNLLQGTWENQDELMRDVVGDAPWNPCGPELDIRDLGENRKRCEALYRMLEHTFHIPLSLGVKPAPSTLATNALRVWQQEFLPPDLAEYHPKGQAIYLSDWDDNFRWAYYGGRTEVYRRGIQEDLGVYDVHSMYPHAMRGAYPHPGRLKYRNSRHLSEGEFLALLETCEGMAQGIARVPQDAFLGLLPIRTPGYGRLVFPRGQFRGAWCFPEIRNLLANGGEFLFEETWYSTEKLYPFTGFVEEFYRRRQAATEEWQAHQYKLMLVSLPGKLGQQGLPKELYERTKKTHEFRHPDRWEWIPFHPGKETSHPGGFWSYDNPSAHSYDSILSFASYTTSMARVLHLQGLQRTTGLVYGDTDSAFASLMPSESLGHGLGEWGKQHTVMQGRFYSPKTYELDLFGGGKIQRCKGIPAKYVPQVFRALREHGGAAVKEIHTRKLAGPKEAIRRGTHTGMDIGLLLSVQATDNKRCWESKDVSRPHLYERRNGGNVEVCGCGQS
jgi:hypothetical protein